MKMQASFVLSYLAMAVLIIGGELQQGCGAQSCAPATLAPCAGVIMNNNPAVPSAECCGAVKAQYSCICDIMKDPNFGKYKVAGKKVLGDCGLASLSCLNV